MSPYKERLRVRLDKVLTGIFDRLENIDSIDERKSREILIRLLQASCAVTHATAIVEGRKAFARLPVNWVTKHLPTIVDQALDLNDDWEFRRLLELLALSNPILLKVFVLKSLKSANPDIVEAGNDFQ